MTKVFAALPSTAYNVVQPASSEGTEFFARAMTGSRHGNKWVSPPVEIIEEDEDGSPLKSFDAAIMGFSGWGIVLTPKAVKRLGGFLADYGEILTLKCNEAELYLFNCTVIAPALDVERSLMDRFPDGRVFGIRRHVFVPSIVSSHDIFRAKHAGMSETYFSDKAVEVWKQSALRGIEFNELWNG